MPDRTLADRPVTGDYPKYSQREIKEQRPISEFLEKLDALFAFPEVEAVRWEQFTPYFNDGDVCTFGMYEADVKFVGDDTSGGREDGFFDGDSYPPGYYDTHYDAHQYQSYGSRRGEQPPADKLPDNYRDERFFVGGVERTDIQAAYEAVSKAVDSEVHAEDFLNAFGDPAQVTATRGGFDVEFYDHE